jgi:DNA polymerase III epsilon subunit-like protein
MTTNHNIGTYVSVDIETTGLNPENCQILEIGAVIDNGTAPIEECPTFHCYVEHGLILGEPFAVSMHATILRRIATREEGYVYLSVWDVAFHFRDFLKEHGLDPENEKIVVAGKNYASFDARFLSKLTSWDKHIKTHHRILDPAALYWQPETDGVKLPDTKTCMQRAGIDGEVAHTAVEDARIITLLIRHAINDRQSIVPDNAALSG